MTKEELKQILENHMHWFNEDCNGWREMRADLRYADLSGAYLSCADLRNADLRDANLKGANLRYADLRDANLSGANLKGAYLSGAYLSGADLSGADLRDANLKGADLSGADLRDANLKGADLSGANLKGAYLSGADLSGADLRDVKNVPYIPMVCPEEGEFIGWKKANEKIVKLHIPEDALRSSATTRKCRCNKAEVIEIYNLDGTISEQRCVNSDWDKSFVYRVGETVRVDNFDKDRWNDYSYGIHFFIHQQEAVEYGLS